MAQPKSGTLRSDDLSAIFMLSSCRCRAPRHQRNIQSTRQVWLHTMSTTRSDGTGATSPLASTSTPETTSISAAANVSHHHCTALVTAL